MRCPDVLLFQMLKTYLGQKKRCPVYCQGALISENTLIGHRDYSTLYYTQLAIFASLSVCFYSFLAPGDFIAVRNQDVTFQPGSTRECEDVTIRDDNVAEDEEDFELQLTTEQDNVIPNPDSTTVNIEDDEGIHRL